MQVASSCGKEAGFDHFKNLALAYYLVPGLEEISAGTGQDQEGGIRGKSGGIFRKITSSIRKVEKFKKAGSNCLKGSGSVCKF